MTTKSFLYCRAGQKDARQLTHLGLVAAADGSVDLRANHQGTGFVVTDEGRHTSLIEFSVGGLVASLLNLSLAEVPFSLPEIGDE